jgi:arylsulfatase A-like enzyme
MNVLIILLDDVGVDQISAYGYAGSAPTPEIDQLAANGMRFDAAWATPVCSPSRAALLTGQFASGNSVGQVIMPASTVELPLEVVTLPEMLDEASTPWASAAVGKWHLSTMNSPSGSSHPLVQGFDDFAGSLNNISPHGERDPSRNYYSWERVGFDGTVKLESTFSTTQITDDAIEAMRDMSEPFLLYVAYHAAHRPLSVPPAELLPPGMVVNESSETSLFAANVAAADAEIGRLVRALGDRRDDTLIFLIGDNGTPSYAKDADGMDGSKGSFTEGGLRVPFIASGRSVKHKGTSSALVSVVDVFPTVMELAGVKSPPQPIDGISLLDVFRNPSAPVHRVLYSELRGPPGPGPWNTVSRAARDRSLKLIDVNGDVSYYAVNGFTETPIDPKLQPLVDRTRIKRLEAALKEHRR